MKKLEKFTQEVEGLLGRLTLEEKISMVHADGFFRSGGVERLNIPSIYASDGPCGVRCEFKNSEWLPIGTEDDYVTYLPCESAVASTWNVELARRFGHVLGEEARGRGKDMILAPGINIKRDPRCGRNFEYMSEDPKVVEKMCVPLIEGVQENDVSVCVKHFAANNQETDRLAIDTDVDERTLREIYLPAFKAAVQDAGALSLMGAYNKFRGRHCCHNEELLDNILRKEWGFDGCVVSDWGGVHDTMEAADTSLDLEMAVTPDFDNYYMANPLLEAVKCGKVSEEKIDEKVRNILRLMFRLKMLGDTASRKTGAYNTREHQQAVYDIASESVILLKNDKKILPLNKKKVKKIAVIGANAIIRHSYGGGSAEIKSLYEITPLMGLKMRLGGNADIQFAQGYFVPSMAKNAIEYMSQEVENWQAASTDEKHEEELEYPYVRHARKGEHAKENEALFAEALEIAKDADAVIYFGGLDHNYDVEGADRPYMELPYDQDMLIEKLLEIRPDTVISLTAGSPVEMPWLDKANTLIWNYYIGMETGTVLADILFGDKYPSGRLAESIPYKYEDTVTYKNGEFGKKGHVEYKEGVFYGYRHYEKENIDVAFPFGFGLGYSDVKYSDIKAEVTGNAENGELKVSVMLTNDSNNPYPVKEIVQVYVGENAPTVPRPKKELKGFAKAEVNPGESKQVDITIKTSELGYYDIEKRCFVTNPGLYTVYAGSSSRDIKGQAEVTI